MNYLLSIVIPTKDRYEYLEQLVDLIISFQSKEIEIVIQDNTYDNNRIVRFLESRNTSNIKYNHIPEQISISLNSDKAILNSSGKYVCFIGDDDGVTRYIVDCVKWMDSKNIGILRSEYAIHKWPSYHSPRMMNISGTLLTGVFDKKCTEYDSLKCLKKLLSSGINNLKEMPKVYNGIVRRDILERIFVKCGTFFPGPSPDMANAVSLCTVESKFYKINFPIIIGGHSAHLGGDTHRYSKNWGPLNEQRFISQKDQDEWSNMVPKVWSSCTVWPQSAISALIAMDETNLLSFIDYDMLLSYFAYKCPDIQYMAYERCSNKNRLKRKVLYWRMKGFLHKALMAIDYYLFNKSDGLRITRGVRNISEAEAVLVRDNAFEPLCE